MRKELFSQREKERGKKEFFFSSFSPEKEEGEKEKREKREGENFLLLLLLFFSSSSEKKEKREGKKSRIEPFLPLLEKIEKRKRNGGKVFLSVFSSCERRSNEMRRKENSFLRLLFYGSGKGGENRNLNLTPREGIFANIRSFCVLFIPLNFILLWVKQGRNGIEKGPCF